MTSDIKNIYDLLYSPIITPYTLLDNSKLSNYSYVKYYKDNENLVAEMECIVADGTCEVFYYIFDNNDYLMQVLIKEQLGKRLLFDRNDKLNEAKSNYIHSKKFTTIAL